MNETRSSDRRRHSPWAILPALAAGLLVTALAVPRLVAAALAVGAANPLWDFSNHQPVKTATLEQAAADIGRAQAWIPDGDAGANRGFLLTEMALRAPTIARRDRLLREAEAATMAGLALSPAQPTAWARLAWLRATLGDRAGAANALRLSMETGSVVPWLMVGRVHLGLELRPVMDRAARAELSREIRLSWIMKPAAIGRLAQNPTYGPTIRKALANLSAGDVHAFVSRNRSPSH